MRRAAFLSGLAFMGAFTAGAMQGRYVVAAFLAATSITFAALAIIAKQALTPSGDN